jgi:alpha,alpha-trehalase
MTSSVASYLDLNQKDIDDVLEYIEKFWPKLIREHKEDLRSLIGLPNPYIVPADGEVFQEQYYWDSYPVVRALINHPKYSYLAIGMVDNLLHLIERFGIIPNASRYYFLSRSQPPLLSSMVAFVYEKKRDIGWLKWAAGLVEVEHNDVWMGKIELRNFRHVYKGLSRYYDLNGLDVLAEAESGWDMTARFMGKCLDFLPVDLNSLLYLNETHLAKFYAILRDKKKSENFHQLAQIRAKTVNKLMWDEDKGYFFDFNFVKEQISHLITVAGVYPLNVGIASKEQASRVIALIERDLQKKYGVVQSVKFVHNLQWDYPNGWPPMQLRTVEAIIRYGDLHLAKRIIKKWLFCNIKVFKETGFLWEKYDVVHGRVGVPDRYPTQPGFAWTNSCFLILLEKVKELMMLDETVGNDQVDGSPDPSVIPAY